MFKLEMSTQTLPEKTDNLRRRILQPMKILF